MARYERDGIIKVECEIVNYEHQYVSGTDYPCNLRVFYKPKKRLIEDRMPAEVWAVVAAGSV